MQNLQFKGKLHFTFFLIMVLNWNSSISQNWIPLGVGTDNQVRSLFADSVTNRLYVGGGQIQSAGGIPANGIASWDGLNWDSLGSGINSGNVLSMLRIGSDIIVCGAFTSAGNTNSNSIAKWNGLVWDSFPVRPNESIDFAKEINNQLCIGGTFTRAGNVPLHLFASWSGTNWVDYNLGIDSNFIGGVFCFELYKNNFYVGGNILFNPTSEMDILRWDSLNSYKMGAGIFGGLSEIATMAIFNDELYVGGYFRQIDGNVGNYIMKWDGVQWLDVGGGTNDHVTCMKVHGQYLYVAGVFTIAGGIPASHIAKWDGNSWSSLGSEIINNTITCMDFFNGELYIGGGFNYIDTVPIGYIAKYTGPVTVGDFAKPAFNFYLTHNPSNSILTVSFSSPAIQEGILTITDASGMEQFRVLMPSQTLRKELDISELAAGIYFITLESENRRVTKKFVKE